MYEILLCLNSQAEHLYTWISSSLEEENPSSQEVICPITTDGDNGRYGTNYDWKLEYTRGILYSGLRVDLKKKTFWNTVLWKHVKPESWMVRTFPHFAESDDICNYSLGVFLWRNRDFTCQTVYETEKPEKLILEGGYWDAQALSENHSAGDDAPQSLDMYREPTSTNEINEPQKILRDRCAGARWWSRVRFPMEGSLQCRFLAWCDSSMCANLLGTRQWCHHT